MRLEPSAPIVLIATTVLVLAGTAGAQDGDAEDPFADDEPLFNDSEDPFAEYEELAEGSEDQQGDGEDGDGSEASDAGGDETPPSPSDANDAPGFGLVAVTLGLAGAVALGRRGR